MIIMRKNASKVFLGKMTANELFAKIGLKFEGMVKRKFRTGPFKPLKPSTIRRKGSSRPMIDTGRLRNSITHRII